MTVVDRRTTELGIRGILKVTMQVYFKCLSEFLLSVLRNVTELWASPDFVTPCSCHHRKTTERLNTFDCDVQPVAVQTVSVAGCISQAADTECSEGYCESSWTLNWMLCPVHWQLLLQYDVSY